MKIRDNNRLKDEKIDIQYLLSITGKEIIALHKRIQSGRIRKVENENIRIQNLRILCSLCKVYKGLEESQKIDNIEDELKELRQVVNELEDGDDNHEV
jgi:hypothetical protein